MIRNAVVHLQGEQPLLADIPALPTAVDTCLVCTNLRTVDGKRPVFVDASAATFVIPLLHIRFIEIAPEGDQVPGPQRRAHEPEEAVEELDEAFLRRVREA